MTITHLRNASRISFDYLVSTMTHNSKQALDIAKRDVIFKEHTVATTFQPKCKAKQLVKLEALEEVRLTLLENHTHTLDNVDTIATAIIARVKRVSDHGFRCDIDLSTIGFAGVEDHKITVFVPTTEFNCDDKEFPCFTAHDFAIAFSA